MLGELDLTLLLTRRLLFQKALNIILRITLVQIFYLSNLCGMTNRPWLWIACGGSFEIDLNDVVAGGACGRALV